jgi:F0F1-type ATP synthase membrane subunit b/b'
MMASVDKSMADARARAQIHVTEMMTEVNQQSTARHAEQEKDMLRKLHKAEADIAVTRQAALSAVHAGAAELAAAIVEKILGSRQRGEA